MKPKEVQFPGILFSTITRAPFALIPQATQSLQWVGNARNSGFSKEQELMSNWVEFAGKLLQGSKGRPVAVGSPAPLALRSPSPLQ
jgi:hypothetical protein